LPKYYNAYRALQNIKEDCALPFCLGKQNGSRRHTLRVVGGVPLLIMKGGISMPIAVIISIISVAFSVFFGLFTLGFNLKNNKKSDNAELTERVKENTRINMKLDTISGNTTEIKNEVIEMRKELNSHDNRIIKVEESVKSAHHRIDGLEARLNEDKEV
jgi:septal ring factor EnvC (AmiA/AmiB activator)